MEEHMTYSACLDGYGTHGPRIQYYGIVDHNGRIAEVLVTREHGRQVSQDLTGVTYRTMREADRDNASKNCAVAAAHARAFSKSPHAAVLGRRGGKSTSPAKRKAARENGKKGGRPKGS